MTSFWRPIERFLRDEDGPTAVEYAVMLALIVITCMSAIGSVGSSTAGNFRLLNDRGAFDPVP
jgi:pilus assembly protein Flp/PilA